MNNNTSSKSSVGSIAVDAMGGDLGPQEVVEAIALTLKLSNSPKHITLVGQEDVLFSLLKSKKLDNDPRIDVFHASEIIGMHEKPVQSLKQKKDSSLVRSIELVKLGQCQAAVSCGNTGSLMACGTLKLRTMPGVERPALSSIWPGKTGHFVMLDVGANPSPKPEHLVHNAILGSWHHKCIFQKGAPPKVGLLSIGTEESKGHELVQATNELLKRTGDLINYIGPIEGFQVFNGDVDIVLCDGFTGNVLLKSSEGLYKMLKSEIKHEIKRTPWRIAGALLLSGCFKSIKGKLNPDRYSGAPLLGLKGNVIKSHGSANRHAISAAIMAATDFVRHDLNQHAEEDILLANERMKSS
ncbi:MAG: phosphate acyltransferase PlsX [Opitutales bacterium]|nr:phosphate acyltransferase PlsX [Opitutales bacterium]